MQTSNRGKVVVVPGASVGVACALVAEFARRGAPGVDKVRGARSWLVWAAGYKRRKVCVGGPTVKAIYGQEVAPAFAD